MMHNSTMVMYNTRRESNCEEIFILSKNVTNLGRQWTWVVQQYYINKNEVLLLLLNDGQHVCHCKHRLL